MRHSSPSAPAYTIPEPSHVNAPPPTPRPGAGSGPNESGRSGVAGPWATITAAEPPQRCTKATADPSGERRGSVRSRPESIRSSGIGDTSTRRWYGRSLLPAETLLHRSVGVVDTAVRPHTICGPDAERRTPMIIDPMCQLRTISDATGASPGAACDV